MSDSSVPPLRRPRGARALDAAALARVAVFAGIIAVLGLPGGFTILGAVPVTAQTLGVMLAGAILGPRLGPLSVAVFLGLVAVGMPLLAGGRGGIGVFFGPTAGYMLGWIAGAAVIGLIIRAGGRRPAVWRILLAILVGGIPVIYAFGIPVQSFVMRLPLLETAMTSLVFLPGDLLKVVVATVIVATLVRAYPRAFRWSTPLPRAAADDRSAPVS